MSYDLTNKNISKTFQNLLQRTGSDNSIYDLEGNAIGDLKISGSLYAQSYVVSSSVTVQEFAFNSGSTIFGDSSDDSHQFTGDITASGNISSSGDLITNGITASGDLYLNANKNIYLDASTPLDNFITYRNTSDDIKIKTRDVYFDVVNGVGIGTSTPTETLDVRGSASFSGHITASGNISSSGKVFGNELQFDAGGVINNIGGNNAFQIKGATDDNLIFTNLSGNDRIGIGQAPSTGKSKLQITGDMSITSHITASGHISASGNVTAASMSIGTIHSSSAHLTVEGDISASGGFFIDDFQVLTGDGSDTTLSASGDVFVDTDDDVYIRNAGSNYVRFDGTNKNVLIGTSNTTGKKLTVAGDISASGDLILEGNITASGEISASGGITASLIGTKDGGSTFAGKTGFGGVTSAIGVIHSSTGSSAYHLVQGNGPYFYNGAEYDDHFKLQLAGDNYGNKRLQIGRDDGNHRVDIVADDFRVSGSISASGDLIVGDVGGNYVSMSRGNLSVSGDFNIDGTINAARLIMHRDDGDTGFELTEDSIEFTVGNETILKIEEDDIQDRVTVGDGGDVDFIVKSAGDGNLIHAVGSLDNVGIGTHSPNSKLHVNGDIWSSGSNGHITASGHISQSLEMTASFGRVEATKFSGDGALLTNVPDYVFETDYILRKLPEVEQHISESKHLPGIPSIDDKEGWKELSVGDRDMLLLEKIEELTLYVISLQKQINELKNSQ